MSGAFGSDFLIKSLFVLLFPKSISLNKDPMTGFCASKLGTSLKNRARVFSVLQTLFSIAYNDLANPQFTFWNVL